MKSRHRRRYEWADALCLTDDFFAQSKRSATACVELKDCYKETAFNENYKKRCCSMIRMLICN